ncbi:hypothetical protein ACEPAG_3134 [Sanghuangporus baumii]
MPTMQSTPAPPSATGIPYQSRQPHPSGVSDGIYPSLSHELVDELKELVHGEVFARPDIDFKPRTTIFNGNVVTPAKAVVIPTSTEDVSKILKFCTKHALHPSIKSGGYGIAGWAINGDVVVDLSKLNGIYIEAPSPSEGGKEFTSLRDMPTFGRDEKGKAKVDGTSGKIASNVSVEGTVANGENGKEVTNGKRRRSADIPSTPIFISGSSQLPRDQLIAKFLQTGNPGIDEPSRAVRRRLDVDSPFSPTTSGSSESSAPEIEASMTENGRNKGADPGLGNGNATMTSRSSSESENGKPGKSLSSDGSMSTSTSASTFISASTSTASTALTEPSTAPDSPRSKSGDSSKEFEGNRNGGVGAEEALDVLSPVSAGLHDQPSLVPQLHQHSSESSLETPTPTQYAEPPPPSRTPSFTIRTEDPFGYMSAPPSAPAPVLGTGLRSSSDVRPPRGYEQSEERPGPSNVPMMVDSVDGPARPSFLTDALIPVHPHAYVSFGAGEKQKDIDIFTATHPLPAMSPGGNTGEVAYHIPLAAHPNGSSVMLLGGFGFLSRLYGLSSDALVEVEMVLADGSIIYVNEEEHPDLWWALRGAGPAFGVVTRYKAKAFPVPIVFAGNLIYNFHPSTAASLIKHFRDCVKSAPRELYANVLLTAGPADKGSLVVVQLCYIGNKERGRKFLEAIESWDGEPCLLNEVSEKSFLAQQDSVAQILRGKAGRQWFIRSALITSLPDEIVHKTVNEFADTPIGCTWLFELAGGAVGDADDTCLPKAQREAGFTIAAFHQWELDDDDPLCVTTAEHWIEKTLSPVSTGGPYPAFLGRHESASRIMGCFGQNWDRLREIKQKYDPRGLFRHTFWPLDVEGNVSEPCEREPKSPIMHPRELKE